METDSSLGFTSQQNQAYSVITSSLKDPILKEGKYFHDKQHLKMTSGLGLSCEYESKREMWIYVRIHQVLSNFIWEYELSESKWLGWNKKNQGNAFIGFTVIWQQQLCKLSMSVDFVEQVTVFDIQ